MRQLSLYYIIPLALIVITLMANVFTDLLAIYMAIYSCTFWYLIIFTVLTRVFHYAPKTSAWIGTAVPILGLIVVVIISIATIEGGPYGWGRSVNGYHTPGWIAPGIPLAEAISNIAHPAMECQPADMPDPQTANAAALLGSRWLDVSVSDFAVQKDGHFLLRLYTHRCDINAYRLIRLAPDGTPDPLFRFLDPLINYDELILGPDDRFLILSNRYDWEGPLRLYSRDGELLQTIPLAKPLGEHTNFRFGPGRRIYTALMPHRESDGPNDPPARIDIIAFDLVPGATVRMVRSLTLLKRSHPMLRSIDDVLVADDGKIYITASLGKPGDEGGHENVLLVVSPGAAGDKVVQLPGAKYRLPIHGFLPDGSILIGSHADAFLYKNGVITKFRAPLTTARLKGKPGEYTVGPAPHPAGGFALLAQCQLEKYFDLENWSHPIELLVVSADGKPSSSIPIPVPKSLKVKRQ